MKKRSKKAPGGIVYMHTTRMVRGHLVSTPVSKRGREKFSRSRSFKTMYKVLAKIPSEVVDERDVLEKL